LALIWADIPQISGDVGALIAPGAMIAPSAGFGNDKSRIAWAGAAEPAR